ncbi:MAG: hypothetical protein K1X51_18580, partial [Rhodospirillaceae bacterium]|nr:hypothetical protein [Rhodospirillaceae bacterium]
MSMRPFLAKAAPAVKPRRAGPSCDRRHEPRRGDGRRRWEGNPGRRSAMSIDLETKKLERVTQGIVLEDTAPVAGFTADLAGALKFVPAQPAYNLIFGSNLDDDIQGTAQNDMILANAGYDVVHGGGGDDWIDGGGDADDLYGGRGNDLLMGGDGDD